MQYRLQQAMQGQFPPVSGPSHPQGHYGYQPSNVYPMGQPWPPVYVIRAPAAPMPGMQRYQTQTFEPRAREKKKIQIKDPNSNKDVTQEILNRQPSGSLTGSTGGTPNNTTPEMSGQNSSSSTPPLTSQQQAEANVRAQFAAQVAATLVNNTEEKSRKPEVIIQKAPVNNKAEVDTVQIEEPAAAQKEAAAKESKINATVGTVTETQLTEKPVEKAVETQPKEAAVKTQPREAAQGAKLSEGVSADSALGSKSLVSSVDATTSANQKISNVRVEIFTAWGGTPNNTTPEMSGQNRSSSTPPLTSQHQGEAHVRAEFAAQVAATVVNSTEEKSRKPEVIIQKAPVNNKAEVDTVQIKEPVDAPKILVVQPVAGLYSYNITTGWPLLALLGGFLFLA